jgi:hypothetical protein
MLPVEQQEKVKLCQEQSQGYKDLIGSAGIWFDWVQIKERNDRLVDRT